MGFLFEKLWRSSSYLLYIFKSYFCYKLYLFKLNYIIPLFCDELFSNEIYFRSKLIFHLFCRKDKYSWLYRIFRIKTDKLC